MRARALALPAAEVAVGGRGAAFSRRDQVAVDADAHRAAGLAPFETGIAEDAVEPLLLRPVLDQRGAGGDQPGDLAPSTGEHGCRRPQVLDAGVGARADEHAINRD